MISRRLFAQVMGVSAASLALGSLAGCANGGASSGGSSSDTGTSGAPAGSASQAAPAVPLTSGMVCVTEYAGNTLALVDAEAGAVLHHVAIGQNPTTLAWGAGVLYVGSSGGGEVRVVPQSDAASSYAVSVGTQPLGLCFDESRGRLYVADYFNSCVHIVDAALQSVVGVMNLPLEGYHNRTDPPDCCRTSPGKGRRTVSMALSPDSSLLYCANYGTYDIGVLDVESGASAGAFDGVVGPRTIMVSHDGAQLLLAGVGGEGEELVSHLYVIDRETGARVNEVYVGQAVSGVCQTTDGTRAFVLSRDEGFLAAFDCASWGETARCSLGAGVDALTVSPDDVRVYVTNSQTGVLSVIDATTMTLVQQIEGLANPKGVSVVP